jgi:uncharacterized protein
VLSKLIRYIQDSTLYFFLFEKNRIKYRVAGSCNMCGQCCRKLILGYRFGPVKSHRQFKKLLKRRPEYKIFKPYDEVSEDGYLRFSCMHVTEDGKCAIHPDRPDLCRRYPELRMIELGGGLPSHCGYKFVPEDNFEEILTEKIEKSEKGSGR